MYDESNHDIYQYAGQCLAGKCLCPKGYYCPSSQLQEPLMCSKGSYQPNYGSINCLNCPAGSYCPWSESVSPKEALLCDKGYECPGSQSNEIQCSLGQYQNLTGQISCNSCFPGTYSNSLGMVNCQICDPEYYCPGAGMSTIYPCPAEYYCYQPGINSYPEYINQTIANVLPSDLNDTIIKRPQQCPTGYYCQLKTKSPVPCPIGSYQSLAGSTECVPCPLGRLCPSINMSYPSNCPAGYYCEGNKQLACPAAYYCLINTETGDPNSTSTIYVPLPCPPGTYCTGGNTEGTINSTDAYSAQPCGQGLYNDEYAQSSCKNCPAGYECLSIGMSEPAICSAGTYRPSSQIQLQCIECSEGTYNPNQGSISSDSCVNCTAGIVCNMSGAPNQDSSYPCPAGYYCLSGTSRNTRSNNPCPPGYYCFAGTPSYESALLNPCPKGRYCGSATVGDDSNCTDPTICTIGSICSANYYCPLGAAEMILCPNGTTSSNGAGSISDCIRTVSTFYSIEVVSTAPVISTVNVSKFSYYQFDLGFLNNISNATMPEDYQILINMSFNSSGSSRRLQANSVKNLLVSNNNYGTTLGIPLIFSSKNVLSSGSNLKLGIQMNADAQIDFIFQFLSMAGLNYLAVRKEIQSVCKH